MGTASYLITARSLSFSMFFIHLLACPCGSIINGQRRAFATITPLSTENESFGRPLICHCLEDVKYITVRR